MGTRYIVQGDCTVEEGMAWMIGALCCVCDTLWINKVASCTLVHSLTHGVVLSVCLATNGFQNDTASWSRLSVLSACCNDTITQNGTWSRLSALNDYSTWYLVLGSAVSSVCSK